MLDKIGLIPMDKYLHGLQFRGLGRKDSISYTKEIYNIDLDKNYDINHPPKIEDDGTRGYFEKQARKRFIKMSEIYLFYNTDYFFSVDHPNIVHHIFPLMYSQDNSMFNLILTSDVFHNILHNNPLESVKKFNYQAVDYLYYLGHSGFNYLSDKYNFSECLDMTKPKTVRRIVHGSFEDEMEEFYKYISYQNSLQIAV